MSLGARLFRSFRFTGNRAPAIAAQNAATRRAGAANAPTPMDDVVFGHPHAHRRFKVLRQTRRYVVEALHAQFTVFPQSSKYMGSGSTITLPTITLPALPMAVESQELIKESIVIEKEKVLLW